MFNGRMGRKRFAIGAAVAVGFMVAATLLYPAFLLLMQGNCGSVSGACGAVALLNTMLYKPLVFAIFIFLLIGPCVRRSRDAGLTAWPGLLVPLLFLADNQFLVFGGSFWAYGFSSGVLGLTFPWFAILGLVSIAALGSLPTVPGDGPMLRRFGVLGIMVAVVGTVLVICMAVRLTPLVPPLQPLAYWARVGTPYVVILFGVLIVVAAATFRSVPEVGSVLPPPHSELRLPYVWLGLAAIAIGVATVALAFPERGLVGMMLVYGFATIVLPTAALYFLPLVAMALLIKGRTAAGVVVAVAGVLPFVLWGYDRVTRAPVDPTGRGAAEFVAEASVIYPPVVVVTGTANVPQAVWDIPGVKRVLGPGRRGTFVEVTREMKRFEFSKAMADVPPTYLQLRYGGRGSRFIDAKGPYDLALVSPVGEQLIAQTYLRQEPRPVWLPVVTSNGWLAEQTQNQERVDPDTFLAQFLHEALANARPEVSPVS